MPRASNGIARGNGSADLTGSADTQTNAPPGIHRAARRPSGGGATSLTCPEQSVASIAEPGEDVSLGVELAVERRAVDHDIGMSRGETSHAFGRCDDAEKANA